MPTTRPSLVLEILGVFGHGMLVSMHVVGILFTWLVNRRWLSAFHALSAVVSIVCFCFHLQSVKELFEQCRPMKLSDNTRDGWDLFN